VDPAFLSLFLFLAAVLTVAGAYSILSDLYLRDRSRMGKRVDEEFRKRQRDRAQKSTLFKNLGALAAEAASEQENDSSLRRRFEDMVEQSGMDITPRRLLTIAGGLGVGLAGVTLLLTTNLLGTAIVFVAGGAAPLVYVQLKRKARLYKMLSQLPDTFDLMSRVIRAGQTVAQALQAVADEFQPPIAAEFAYCYEQQNLGLPAEESLRDLARRTGLLEIKIFVLAMLVQQQTGGSLAELLDKLANMVRERFRLQGKIKALTAEGRFQAVVLLALPPAMLLLIMILNRAYGRILFEHPNLLVTMVVAEGIGALWIRKIVNFDY
jgi:tight adherence protein B